MIAAGRELTVVMYHFVQPADRGPAHGLKHLDIADFRDQLTYVATHHTPVSADEVLDALEDRRPLPPRAALLTFDDGYRCHYEDALPALEERSMPALFFPVAAALLDRRMLDVNKIQCILAAADVADLVATIDRALETDRAATPTIAELRAAFWKPSRWDPAPVVYVKRLLQHALPDAIRRPLVDELFRTRVSADEPAFANELYMTVDQLRDAMRRGVAVGAHGDRHLRLPALTDDEQAKEIGGALRVLDAVGVPRRRFVYSYANGEHDDRSAARLDTLGCAAAFTTRPAVAQLRSSERLRLPRLDTNDLLQLGR